MQRRSGTTPAATPQFQRSTSSIVTSWPRKSRRRSNSSINDGCRSEMRRVDRPDMRAKTSLGWCVASSVLTASFTAPRLVAAQISALKIIVLEGEDAVNLIDKKTAVKPTVEVRDRNDLPVAGALIRFAIRGRAATFGNGAREFTVTTASLGRATVNALTPARTGAFEIDVNASYQGQTATTTMHQTNYADAAQAARAGKAPVTTSGTTTAAGGVGGGGLSGLAVAGIVGGAAAGAATAVIVAKRGNTAPSVGSVTASPTTALQNATSISFSVQANDPDGDALTYSWDFGEGASATGQTAAHLYTTSGSFTVRATARDQKSSADGQTTVTVRNLSGTWAATTIGSMFGDITEVYTLSQTGTSVAGSVSATSGASGIFPTGPVSNGSVRDTSPRITFTVTHTGFVPYTFTGDTGPDVNTLVGVCNGSGYSNQPVTVTRR